jgi:hypothetical protein
VRMVAVPRCAWGVWTRTATSRSYTRILSNAHACSQKMGRRTKIGGGGKPQFPRCRQRSPDPGWRQPARAGITQLTSLSRFALKRLVSHQSMSAATLARAQGVGRETCCFCETDLPDWCSYSGGRLKPGVKTRARQSVLCAVSSKGPLAGTERARPVHSARSRRREGG